MKFINNQKGYVVLITTFFILIIMLSVALTMSSQVALEQKTTTNAVKSTQAYYAAESGIEDALLILRRNPQLSSANYSLNVNGATANIIIPIIVGGTRAVASQGNNKSMVRGIQTVYVLDSQGISFHYGTQVGAGGLSMGSNSEIDGNVFSNGNITGSASGNITGDVVVSGNGNKIENVDVEGNILAYSCLSSTNVGGNLTYVAGGLHTCTVAGTTTSQPYAIVEQSLPITPDQIDSWKAETAGGTTKSAYSINSNATVTENSPVVITGNMSVGSNATWNLMGFTKIIGNLTIGSNARVNMGGTLYVTGAIGFGSNSVTQLNNFYGAASGIILADGNITVNSNAILRGSGQTGSYILVLSTSSLSTAISVGSNSTGAIFYTSAGGVQINSNADVREVTGYKVSLGSNATLQYESGLANASFSSGPSGSWKVTSWTEE